jgi:hypothetical protein
MRDLEAGDWVEVGSKNEILSALEKNGWRLPDRRPRGGILRGALQPPPGVLPTEHLLAAARHLAGKSSGVTGIEFALADGSLSLFGTRSFPYRLT